MWVVSNYSRVRWEPPSWLCRLEDGGRLGSLNLAPSILDYNYMGRFGGLWGESRFDGPWTILLNISGKARPDMNVHVYVCGNDGLVHDLQSVCESCARESLARKRTPLQKYVLHYERFG